MDRGIMNASSREALSEGSSTDLRSNLSSSVSIFSDNLFDYPAVARYCNREIDPTEPGIHKVTIAVTVSLSVSSAEVKEKPAKTTKKNKAGLKSSSTRLKSPEPPKAQQFLRCEYELLPGDENPVRTDLVVYDGFAKVYVEQQEPGAVKTWTNGCITWISWTNCHSVTVTDLLLKNLTTHKVVLRIWDGKERVGPKVKSDRPKGFRILKSEDAENQNAVEGVIKKQCENYLYFRPRVCFSYEDLMPRCPTPPMSEVPSSHSNLTITSTQRSKGLLKAPSSTKRLKVPTASDMEMSRPESPTAGKNKSAKAKNASKKVGVKPLSKEELQQLKQKKSEIDKNGLCSIRLSLIRLFTVGVTSVTERLSEPVVPVRDSFISLSLSEPLLSPEQMKILNPLVIEVQSASNLPSVPVSFEELRQRCKPAYFKYKIFNCVERLSKGLPQDCNLVWDDLNIILAGLIDECLLREYLAGPRLEIEVHDRDRIIKIPEDKGALFGECADDEKISSVGIVTSRRTIQNAFKKSENPWDPYGVARFDLSELLLGRTVLYIEESICNSPCPDVLGLENQRDGLVGFARAVDGPVDPPMKPSDYLYSGSQLKIKIQLAHPLLTPEELVTNAVLSLDKCSFARIVFKLERTNKSFLQKLHSFVVETNIKALGLLELSKHVRYTALATYTLSVEQMEDTALDIISGFKISDGEIHLYVLEGLRNGAMKHMVCEILQEELPPEVRMLYHSNLGFQRRLYASLGPDLHCIKLHEPLSVIMQQQRLFIRDFVPSSAFQGLCKIHLLSQVDKLRLAVKNDLFPSAACVVAMNREFGVPVQAHHFKEVQIKLEKKEKQVDDEQSEKEKTETQEELLEYCPEIVLCQENEELIKKECIDWAKVNQEYINILSCKSMLKRMMSEPEMIQADVEFGHNYGNQKLNSAELAKEKLRKLIAKEKDVTFTYCPDYHHSGTFPPVDLNKLSKKRALKSKERWLTCRGWTHPNTRSTIQKRAHERKLDSPAVEELLIPLDELYNLAEASFIARLPYAWNYRKLDMDIWTSPTKCQATFMDPGNSFDKESYAGRRAENQLLTQKRREEWQAKVVVDDVRQHFHRCAIDTELQQSGLRSSNQIARLRGLLKDCPAKHSLKRPPMVLYEIPALSVVNYPSVDVACQKKGMAVPSVCPGEELKCFNPGSHTALRLSNSCNSIPVTDYNHKYFEEKKGKDFNLYVCEKKKWYTRPILPLDEREKTQRSSQCIDWQQRLEEMEKIREWNNCITRSLVENHTQRDEC